MNNSLVSKYFDFGQALEFLREGLKVSNVDYNDEWFLYMEGDNIHITNGAEEYWKIDNILQEISISDILNEKWFIYGEHM